MKLKNREMRENIWKSERKMQRCVLGKKSEDNL